MKAIYFCIDSKSKEKALYNYPTAYYCFTYHEMDNILALKKDESIITTSLAHLSFDLITLGYDIYLCYKDKKVKIEPHMDLSGCGEPCKDLRFGHNLLKLFNAGVFDELIGFERRAMGE